MVYFVAEFFVASWRPLPLYLKCVPPNIHSAETFHIIKIFCELSFVNYEPFLARDALVKTNRRAIAVMFVRLSVRLRRACIVIVRCDVSADFSLWLDNPMFWPLWHWNMPTYSQHSFCSSTWKRGGVWMCKLGMISQEWLSYHWMLIGSHICRVDCHNNRWPWVTLNNTKINVIHIARYLCGRWASCVCWLA